MDCWSCSVGRRHICIRYGFDNSYYITEQPLRARRHPCNHYKNHAARSASSLLAAQCSYCEVASGSLREICSFCAMTRDALTVQQSAVVIPFAKHASGLCFCNYELATTNCRNGRCSQWLETSNVAWEPSNRLCFMVLMISSNFAAMKLNRCFVWTLNLERLL